MAAPVVYKNESDLTLFEQIMGKTWDGHDVVIGQPVDQYAMFKSAMPSLFEGSLIQAAGSYAQLSFLQAVNFYLSCGPLFHAIDKLATEVAAIDPIVWDQKSRAIVDGHPILGLLDHPGPATDYRAFMYTLATWYLLTGNAFPYALGNVKFEPAELWIAPPHFVVGQSDSAGQPLGYQTDNQQWRRREMKRRWRFYSDDNLSELLPMKTFAPGIGGSMLYGVSKLLPVLKEVEQYNAANIHNLSLLLRGARPSVLFSTDAELTDKQFTRLQEQINQFYVGAHNAGRPLLGEGGMKAADLMVNNKDMDFLSLKKDMRENIFTALDIPLSLVSSSAMTYDNVENGALMLYQQAVLPLAKTLFGSLSRWLMPRYKGSESLVITYDERSIPALRYRRMQTGEKMAKIPVFSDNEVRAEMGYEPVEGGDAIYKPATLIPVGRDTVFDQPTAPDSDLDNEETLDKQYRDILRHQKDVLGRPAFTEEQINEFCKAQFGG